MAINLAGTAALGDYLVSRIANARTLMGLGNPGSGSPMLESAVSATAMPHKAMTATQLQDQVRAQRLANTQILFGVPTTADVNANALPPIAAQTPQQLVTVAVESSRIALQFATIATLFGSNRIGAHTNSTA
jgi:hypothetical protein